MLLLVTNQRDITMDYVVAEIRRRDVPYFRLNTERLPQSLCAMASHPRSAWSISIDGRMITGDQITAAYFRRPGAPYVPESVTDAGERAYIAAEWSSFLKSFYARLGGRWLNSPSNIFAAEDKPLQLLMAHELGFKVPTVTVTNDIESARQVAEMGQAIGKPLRQAVLTGERERVIFTTRLGKLEDDQAQSIALTPFIVQSEIVKKYDVRVTVVGEYVFATAIWSQDHVETEVDWRQGSRPDLRHEKIELPVEIQKQCIALVSGLGLRYGAIDLVCDQQDELWFLEINPNGQWAWIENLTGYPIASAIVDDLLKIARG
ncbi:MvdC/MvdD family ATP grasp protein [Pseudomonas rossensis]|uniref:MvdC/MvdD family ATP grasp protein n=1 Tax=Pseudomonas rossensis TaxID=2305471 RepID=UPI0032602504